MITVDLIEYIKSQLSKNISKEIIISNLTNVGWRMEDIGEGFANVESKDEHVVPDLHTISENLIEDVLSQNKPEEKKEEPKQDVSKVFDKYRELPDGIEPLVEKKEEKSAPTSSLELLKIWVPTSIKPKTEEVVKIGDEQKVIQSQAEPQPQPQPQAQSPEVKLEPTVNQDNNPVIKPEEFKISQSVEIEPYKIEVPEEKPAQAVSPIISLNKLELPKEEKPQVVIPKVELPKKEEPIATTAPNIINNPTVVATPEVKNTIEPEKTFTPETTIPVLNNKVVPSKIGMDSINPIQKPQPVIKPAIPQNSMSDISPKNAMISSYSQAILSSAKESESNTPTKKKSLLKWIIVILVVFVIGGMIFAFVEGYLKLPGSRFSLSVVKKDPKTIILEAPSVISKLKSYKSETNISISSPSLSNITTGLSSGEVVTSKDKDSISVNIKGYSNNKNDKLSFDYVSNIKSSLLKSDINSDWKYDGSKLFVSVPDLNQIFGKDTPPPATVSMDPNQLGLITQEFSAPIQNIIKKVDIYNILSNDVPLYVKNEISSIFKEFIGTLSFTEKEDENIRGVDTYHYEMSASRPATKKMLNQVVELLIAQLPADQKSNLDEALGASTISAFEVWVGKNGDSLYQFKFTLDVPLSKVLGVSDSGIADNEVKLDWITTYYDLNIDNNIIMPSSSTTMEEFIKGIRDIKIKNVISSFKPQATLLKNAIGSYGARSNPMGSCTNPNPGSLFSPQGHTKGAEGALSAISTSMISLLTATNGIGSCYSTSSAWALAAPISGSTDSTVPDVPDKNLFYCTDSTGKVATLPSAITGPVCK